MNEKAERNAYRRQFAGMLQSAAEENADRIIAEKGVPELDLSFMREDFTEEYKPVKKRMPWSKAARVAVILVCFFTAVSAAAIWIASEPANALKLRIQGKLYEISEGIFSNTEQDEEDYTENSPESRTIYSEDDMYAAEEFVENLLKPGYLPEGFALESLTIDKWYNGNYEAEYIYKNADDLSLSIWISYIPNVSADGTVVLSNVVESEELLDKTIYTMFDETENIASVSVMFGAYSYDILGDISPEEMREIARKIQ